MPVDQKSLPPAGEDLINRPAHYMRGIEVIEFIESWSMNFSLGNVIKYVTRAPHKGHYIEDLKKAQWYLKHVIEGSENLERFKKQMQALLGTKISKEILSGSK